MKIKQKTCLFSPNINRSFFFRWIHFILNTKIHHRSGFFINHFFVFFLVLRSIWQIKDTKYDTVCQQEFDQFCARTHQKYINFYPAHSHGAFISVYANIVIIFMTQNHVECISRAVWKNEKKYWKGRRKILKQFKTDEKVYLFEKLFERIIKKKAENFAWVETLF